MLDWEAAFQLPTSVVDACRLQGVWDMVWKDDGSDSGWESMLSSSQYEKRLRKGAEAVQDWLKTEGASQVRQKQKLLAATNAAATQRLSSGYEGQVVLANGAVSEVRGLLTPVVKSSADSVYVLAYELVSRTSRSQTIWQLSHSAQIKLVKTEDLQLVEWRRIKHTAKLQVLMQ